MFPPSKPHDGDFKIPFQADEGGVGAASVESGRRKRKGRNDDELSGEGESTSAMGMIEKDEEDSAESGRRFRAWIFSFHLGTPA